MSVTTRIVIDVPFKAGGARYLYRYRRSILPDKVTTPFEEVVRPSIYHHVSFFLENMFLVHPHAMMKFRSKITKALGEEYELSYISTLFKRYESN